LGQDVSVPALCEPIGVQDGWLDVLPNQADCLRDYQREQIAAVAAIMHGGVRRILVQLPTGGGKTHIIAAIVAAATLAGLRVLVLATRTRLVRQLHDRLEAFGVRHGVIAAALPELRDFSALVQIASVDTLHRRAIVASKQPLPSADLVIFDEAHLATADTRLRVLESFPAALRMGFSATPARKSGRSLAAAFDCIVHGPSIRELTATGVLVPVRIFNSPVVTKEELREVPKGADRDYQPAALGKLLSRPKLIGDVVSNWLRIASGKRTLVFAVNKSHGAALLESFRRQGIPAEMLVDQDAESVREATIDRLERGATKVLINCFLMSYGVDVPSVECIVLARPTRSLVMYLQMVGRGLRPSPETDKQRCILIDHGRVVENLGMPQNEFGWTLNDAVNVNSVALGRSRKQLEENFRTCPECSASWMTSEDGNACPVCGWVQVPKSVPIPVEEADLEELTESPDSVTPIDEQVVHFYQEACGWYMKRWPDRWMANANRGRWWAWSQTRVKFGFELNVPIPRPFWEALALPPSEATSGWLKYRQIRWAKSKARAA